MRISDWSSDVCSSDLSTRCWPKARLAPERLPNPLSPPLIRQWGCCARINPAPNPLPSPRRPPIRQRVLPILQEATAVARIVMKFGGTSMAGIERIRNVATRIKREVEAGNEMDVVEIGGGSWGERGCE